MTPELTPHTRALTLWVGAIIDELATGGVTNFVVCPGSRSTPLALAVARHPLARVWVLLDERSAGFFALGIAQQSGRPAALICTSGTAAANFLPAVAEADLARVPLLVLTADRPPELRDNGAPQTIDQVRLYGPRTRWFSELPPPADTPELLRYARTVAARAIAVSRSAPAGPVHLNLPFREPLVPDRATLEDLFECRGNTPSAQQSAVNGIPGSVAPPTVHVVAAPRHFGDELLLTLSATLAQHQHGLIICGPDCPPGLAPAVARLATRLGYPILADPLSGVRHGPHDRQFVLSAYDAFLRDERFVARHAPTIVLRFGAMPTAKPVLQLLQRHPTAHQIIVDAGGGWREPTSLAAEHLACDPVWLCDALSGDRGQPSVVSGQWSAVSGQPSVVSGQPSVVSGQPSVVSGQPSVVSGQWSAVSGQWSVVSGQSSVVSGQPPVVSGQSPVVSGQPSVASGQQSAINNQQSTISNPPPWAHAWLTAEYAARAAITEALVGRERLSEPGVFGELAALLPDGATLFVGNSMPVRDCDTFFASTERRITILGNRGANGIDGLVSTALGAVAAGAAPLVMVIGDISLYHDSNGLLAGKLHALDATIVLINNDGGGIFSFLPQASEADRFELLFGTPHGLSFAPLAALYGACYTLAETWAQFHAAVGAGIGGRGLHLIEVRTERGQNVADHRAIWPLVSAALERAGVVSQSCGKL